MSDPGDVPELSAEARAFLARHEATGEPSAEALARVGERVSSPTPAPARPARSWLTHEVMAAAAVLLVLVGAQGLYLYFRAPTSSDTPEVKAVVEAYRAGDLQGAQRLASQSCADAACKPLASSLGRALGLANRLDSLSATELEQLATLDAELSAGSQTALGLRVAQRLKVAPVVLPSGEALLTAERLFSEAGDEKKAKNYERAVELLEQCVRVAPGYHPCYRQLGSVFASIASRDGSVTGLEKARAHYTRFLELAPPDDAFVPKVEAILQQAADAPRPSVPRSPRANDDAVLSLGGPASPVVEGDLAVSATGEVATLFLKASMARTAGDWPRALELAQRVQELDPRHGGAQAILDEGQGQAREVYLRGYQLKDSSPEDAVVLFREVMKMTPANDVQHQKAKARLSELRPETGPAAPEPGDGDDAPADVSLRLRESRDLALKQGVLRLAIGDPEIADVEVLSAKIIRVKAVGKGKTTLVVWLRDGQREHLRLEVR